MIVAAAEKNDSILIEALVLGNDSGLGRVARMLVLAFREAFAGRRVCLITRRGVHPGGLPSGWILKQVKARPYRIWIRTVFPFLIRRFDPSLVICLGQTIPRLRKKVPHYLLVPDAGPCEPIDIQTSKFDPQNKRQILKNLKRADRILTISEFSRSRISVLGGVERSRIDVFRPIGDYGSNPSPATADQAALSGRLTASPFILSLGNIEPRKNHLTVLKAYSILRGRIQGLPKLIFAGHRAWGYEGLSAAAIHLELEEHVVFTGHVPEAVRLSLLKKCLFYVSGSVYEGWGFPLFEALSCGRPAIYHLESSQREFAEGFALGIDCSDAEALAAAMERLCTSKDLRTEMESRLRSGFSEVMMYDLPGRLREIFAGPSRMER